MIEGIGRNNLGIAAPGCAICCFLKITKIEKIKGSDHMHTFLEYALVEIT